MVLKLSKTVDLISHLHPFMTTNSLESEENREQRGIGSDVNTGLVGRNYVYVSP